MQLRHKESIYESNKIRYISTKDIRPNKNQPRKIFEEKGLRELADSIREIGIVQPLTVRYRQGRYELVSGERRLRAAKLIELERVPCIVLGIGEQESTAIALIENLQRKDLDFIEEAYGIQNLISTCGLSQEEAAKRLGKSQSAIANKLRLLKHSDEVIERLRTYNLTERHARALLRIEDERLKLELLEVIMKKRLNVAQTESLVDRLLAKEDTKEKKQHKYIVKDVKLFVNTIKNALNIMQSSGVDADLSQEESENEIMLTIKIPKKVGRVF